MSKNMVLMLVGMLVGCLLQGESFVVKPKKKAVSCRTLQESCGHKQHEVIKHGFTIERNFLAVRERITNNLEELVAGDKNSFWAQASKEQLAEYESALEKLQEALVVFEKELEDFYTADKKIRKR